MQAATDHTMFSINPSGQTLSLFVLVVYVAFMPKELMHLIFVFIGATSYLFFLVLQPSTKTHPETSNPQASDKPKSIGVANPDSSTLTPVVAPKVVDMPGAKKRSAAKASKVAAADKEQNKFGAKISNAEIPDKSIAMSADESHGTASDKPSVTETQRTTRKNVGVVQKKQSKPANSISMEADSSEGMDSTMKASTQQMQETHNQQSSEQLHDQEKQQKKENRARLTAFKQDMKNDRVKENRVRFATFKELVNEADNTPAVLMGTETSDGSKHKTLSADAAPFVFRQKLSVNAAPFVCGPCLPSMMPSSSVQPDETESRICWDWESRGFCRRGPECWWEHPQTEIFQEQPLSYETMWDHQQTEMFQEQFQSHETVNHYPSHVGVWLPCEVFEQSDHDMVQTPVAGFVDSFYELNTPTAAQTPASGQWNTYLEESCEPGANNSFCEDDNDDLLTDDGF